MAAKKSGRIYKIPTYVASRRANMMGRWQVFVRQSYGPIDTHSNHATEAEADIEAARLNLKEAESASHG